jgi:nucleoside-diphosphate-sugar epimerase
MKAIVTGACGFLGFKLCNKLLDEGWEVIAIDRNQLTGAIASHPKMSFFQCDLSTQGFLLEEVDCVDVLFHLAGATLGAGSDEHLFFLTNELTAMNVFKACAGRVGRIVHASSQVVYGNIDSIEVDENYPLCGYDTAYGCSKVNSENWLRWFQKKAGGVAIALRFSGFVEGGGAISYFIEQAMQNKPIEVFDQGNVCRDYLAVENGLQAFLAAAKVKCERPGFVPYNIGSGDVVKTIDLARLVCEEVGSSSEVIPVFQKGPRPNFVFNIGKARTELGFLPTPLKTAVQQHIMEVVGNIE